MNGTGDTRDHTSKLLAKLRAIIRHPVILTCESSEIWVALRKFGLGPSRKKEIEINVQDVNLTFLSELDALALSNEEFGKVLPIALILAIENKSNESVAKHLHPYLWQIWDRSGELAFESYDATDRMVVWDSLEYVFEQILDLAEDPFWIENKKTLIESVIG